MQLSFVLSPTERRRRGHERGGGSCQHGICSLNLKVPRWAGLPGDCQSFFFTFFFYAGARWLLQSGRRSAAPLTAPHIDTSARQDCLCWW